MTNMMRTAALLSLASLMTACSGGDSITGTTGTAIPTSATSIPASQLRPTVTFDNYVSTATLAGSASSVFAPSFSDTIRTTFVFSASSDSVRSIVKAAVPIEMSFTLSTLEIQRAAGNVDVIPCPLDITRDASNRITASAVRCHSLNRPASVTLFRGDVATLRIAGIQTSATTQARSMIAFFGDATLRTSLAGWRLTP